MAKDYYLKGEVIRCERCLYADYELDCTHPIVKAPAKTVGCDHGETAEMRLERERYEAARANHRD